jgi:hypothetical protein
VPRVGLTDGLAAELDWVLDRRDAALPLASSG